MRFNKQPSGPDASEMVLTYAEVLEYGELGTRPLREAKVVPGGDPIGHEPRFTFHGFRYVQVDGWPELDLKFLTGVVIHTDLERLGEISCSHPMVEQLYWNVNWGMEGNFVSIPSDCP
jgi:alpha-L-rhamnosidase